MPVSLGKYENEHQTSTATYEGYGMCYYSKAIWGELEQESKDL